MSLHQFAMVHHGSSFPQHVNISKWAILGNPKPGRWDDSSLAESRDGASASC